MPCNVLVPSAKNRKKGRDPRRDFCLSKGFWGRFVLPFPMNFWGFSVAPALLAMDFLVGFAYGLRGSGLVFGRCCAMLRIVCTTPRTVRVMLRIIRATRLVVRVMFRTVRAMCWTVRASSQSVRATLSVSRANGVGVSRAG